MNYEKQIVIYWAVVIICMWSTLIFASCVTNYRRTDDAIGRGNLELIGRLEAQFDEFDRRIGRIEDTASDITSDIDRIRDLFAEYTRCVQRLRSTVAEYKNKFGEEAETSTQTKSNSNNSVD